MKNRVSIKQIAETAGVSQGTVSMVLNGRGSEMRISKQTQEKIQQVAMELGYQPNIYARRLRQNGQEEAMPIISLFCPYTSSNPYGRLMVGVQDAILKNGIQAEITLRPFRYDYLEESAKFLSDDYCNGAVIFALSEKDLAFLLEQNFSIPIVLFDHVTGKYGTVYVDEYAAGYRVAELFAARGHKRVGLLVSENRNRAASMRRIGFVDGCEKFGLTLLKHHEIESPIEVDSAAMATQKMLQYPNRPTAIFAALSELAIGALRACRKEKIVVPNEMEIMSYGDNPIEMMLSPSLSSIHLPLEEMSATCMQMVLNMVKTKDPSPVSRIFSMPFMIRESCGDFPKEDCSTKE